MYPLESMIFALGNMPAISRSIARDLSLSDRVTGPGVLPDVRRDLPKLPLITINYRLVSEAPSPACKACPTEEFVEEVRRFRWIEAEKAGCDIWAAHPDPEAAAMSVWVRRHFTDWYRHRASSGTRCGCRA